MAPRRAQFYSYGEQGPCAEVKKFIQDSGILLESRDIEKNPLSVSDLNRIIGFLDLNHFLNTSSDSYKKNGLDKELPSRTEVYELMVQDHTLIKKPIICSKRLVTVGCDKQKIADMLQINKNGESEVIESRSFNTRSSYGKSSSNRGHQGRNSSRHGSSTRK